jgi:HAD superfamily hydrolase (TIGR01509 family)
VVIEGVLFDLGDTLIYEHVDDTEPLDHVQLHAKPGAAEVLETLSHDFSLALVTDTETSAEPAVRRALARLGLEKYFDAVVTSQETRTSKPDPSIFEQALVQLGVSPQRAVMVGNDLDRDILPAQQLGLRTILVTDSPYFDPARTTSARVAGGLAEVPDIITALGAPVDRSAPGS